MEKGKANSQSKWSAIKPKITKLRNLVRHYLKEIIIALVLAVLAAAAAEVYSSAAHQKNIEINRKATATVLVRDKDENVLSQGSGVFVNGTGLLVTNFHVVAVPGWDVKKTLAKLHSGAFYFLRDVRGMDRDSDLALLQFDATETPHIKGLGDSDALLAGQRVIAIGSPLSLENSVSEGVIANPSRRLSGLKFIQFTASISPGSSGGGLYDYHGKAIGITSGTLRDETKSAQNLNFAVPINMIREALTGEAKKLTEESPDYYYSLGQIAETNQKWDTAIKCYKNALSLNDRYAPAYVGLGGVYYEKGQYDLEVSNYRNAVLIDSRNYEYFYYLATAYEDVQEYAKAKEAYLAALSIKPDHKDTLHDFAILSIAEGDCAQAKRLISKLGKLDVGMARKLETLMGRAACR